MRPSHEASNSSSTMAGSTSNAADFRDFHSPIPYLFGGLSLMLALIAVSLLILACSYSKRYSNSSNSASPTNGGGDEEKGPNKMVGQVELSNSEPRIVVIMAGESNPTYLAKPVSSSSSSTSHTQQQQQQV